MATTSETVQRGWRSMSRCEHCQYRNSWECDDGWNRRSNDTVCNDFKLDYDTLTDKQKTTIQKILMREENEEWW